MVSINKLGQVFNYNPSFNAAANNSVQTPDAAKVQEGKAKLKSFAKSQVNLGYATLGAGVLALAGTGLKKGVLKFIAAIPAASVCMMLGYNMMAGGKAVQKAVANTEQPQQPKVDKQA